MAKTYTFSKLSKLGEFDDTYGQRYWCETNEQLEPVMFNSMNKDITADDTIEAEEVFANKKSNKGIMYTPLKKVRVLAQKRSLLLDDIVVTTPDSVRVEPAIHEQLDRMEDKLDKLLGVEAELDKETLNQMPEDFLQ